MATEETVIYEDNMGVKITNRRAILSNKTYAISNITSVSTSKKEESTKCSPVLGFLAFVFLMVALTSAGIIGALTALKAIGLFALAFILGVIAYYKYRDNKPTYFVVIGSASGETNVLSSTNQSYIQKIVDAMNEAIVQRG